MRCKKHQTDYSSTVGVCASCLRERLLTIAAAQTQKQAQLHQSQQDFWKSDTKQPFPRSVSPYISHRKSHTAAEDTWQRFYSTPQLGPTGTIKLEIKKSTRRNFSSMFMGLFRSKSVKPDLGSGTGPVTDPPVLVDSSTASPSWYSTIVPGRKKKQIRTFSIDESIAIGPGRKTCPIRDRGMSPVRYYDEENEEKYHGGLSGYSSESSQGWKKTPRRTPASQRSGVRTAAAHSRSVSGLAFCLSPLVRASPKWHLGQKCMPPDVVAAAGESRVPSKPRLSNAASFCKNRSRKLADIGRYNYNTNY